MTNAIFQSFPFRVLVLRRALYKVADVNFYVSKGLVLQLLLLLLLLLPLLLLRRTKQGHPSGNSREFSTFSCL